MLEFTPAVKSLLDRWIKVLGAKRVVVTPTQQRLIEELMAAAVGEDELLGIMMLMDTPKRQEDLMMWMSENKEATPSDILGKAMEISR